MKSIVIGVLAAAFVAGAFGKQPSPASVPAVTASMDQFADGEVADYGIPPMPEEGTESPAVPVRIAWRLGPTMYWVIGYFMLVVGGIGLCLIHDHFAARHKHNRRGIAVDPVRRYAIENRGVIRS